MYAAYIEHIGRITGSLALAYATYIMLSVNIVTIADHHLWYWLLSSLNLGIHEAGHFLFMAPSLLLGTSDTLQLLTIVGGSLAQWLAPVFITSYFAVQRNWYAASFVLYWLGQSLHNSVLYIQDASYMILPLLGDEGVLHDWSFILMRFNMLQYDFMIGEVVKHIAQGICVISVVLCSLLTAYQWLQTKKSSSLPFV